jgi:putative hydrolase of the HAD superfamily
VIRALLVDLDGVLRIWTPDHGAQIERHHGLPIGTIAAAAFAADLLEPALTGVISDEVWRERVARRIAEQHGSQTAGAVEAWSSFRGVVDQPVLSLVREVRDLMPVVLLTNQTSRLTGDLDALGLADAFDAIANSADIGFAKPARETFEEASRLARVSPSECILIDDRVGNIDMARRLGMSAIQHVNAVDTRRALVGYGVPLTREAGLG